MSNCVCPFCLNKLSASDVEYQCPQCGNKVQQSPWEYIRHLAPRCPDKACGGRLASTRVCKHCGHELPADILDYGAYLRFCVLGVTGAGKSMFVTTMLHEYRKCGIPLVISGMDTDTITIFGQNEQKVYGEGVTLDATLPGAPPVPMQWRMQDMTRMTDRRIPTFSMTLFDGAGEDCEHIDPTISRYIEGSKTIVIVLDPLQLAGVRPTLDEEIVKRCITADHSAQASVEMANGLINYIRRSCNIRVDRMIGRDVAVVFTKMDVLMSQFGSAQVTSPSPHVPRGGFVQADADAVDAEIRDWLIARGEQEFIRVLEAGFGPGRVKFFGVSSTGQPPREGQKLGKVMPHRVLDPILWMLAKEKLIRTI